MKETTSSWKKRRAFCWDIFGAEVLQEFKGPDGHHFLDQPPGELRLIFSLFLDFFNPYGNKAAGKKASLGGVYLICYNLPIELRYRIENVYIAGIIPGEPLLHHINHILRPLVSDLIQLWNHGVKLSRTSSHNHGCLVRVALIPLIADAPAARKAAGFPGVTATDFCIFCKQTKSQLHDYDVGSWVRHNRQDHMKAAQEWRESRSPSDRDKVMGEEHVRWSELLRLPYWDVTSFVVVDPMHTLFLNVVQHHVRDLWKIKDSKKNGRKGISPHSPSEQKEFIDVAYSALMKENLTALTSVRWTYLELLVKENDIVLKPEDKSSIPKLGTALIAWKRSLPRDFVPKLPTPFSEPAVDIIDAKDPEFLLDSALIMEIRHDMARTVLPGWINRAPKNFGSASHGKVSADHWRTAFTINFVITLVRIWGHPNANTRQGQLLENFMALVAAIRFATARTTTETHIQTVEQQLQRYFRTLSNVSDKRYPSHHMSLHIAECLRRFGPVHGWWSYPYERYNGILQRLNHNNKLTAHDLHSHLLSKRELEIAHY
ncbi:hypothetical protein NLJ89_g8597 [Agrocybe chaxingu]|uniref:Transposase n=1 Tax=Agrocybe chaxingu TaxID=84603 RepID=A0A9W8JUY5_9AGAR|nr:hypothetical protein NLJ89_g8597 [Agrocybe chaxingu]